MDFNAFDFIQGQLSEELLKQGFSQAKPLADGRGEAVIFSTEDAAYSLLYDGKAQHFELRSASVDEGEPGEWRRLAMWLFDEKEGERSDAESIANDFLEIIRGPRQLKQVQQKRKRGKDEERSVDPVFFINRLVNIFPEIKEDINGEKIGYGQVRPATFVRDKLVPKCEALAKNRAGSDAMKKLCALLDDMYKNGDMDLRSVVTSVLLNGLSDEAFAAMREGLGEELQKSSRFSRRLRGKQVKPEKKKKQKKVEARLDASR